MATTMSFSRSVLISQFSSHQITKMKPSWENDLATARLFSHKVVVFMIWWGGWYNDCPNRLSRLLAFTTFGRDITFWAFAPFGCSSVEGHVQSSWNWKKEIDDNDTNKKMKWKNLVSWNKGSNSRRDNMETNKTMVRE